MGARAGRSSGGNVTSGTDGGGGTWNRHGAKKEHSGKKVGRLGWKCADPWGVGRKSGGRETSGVDPVLDM